MAYLQLQPPKKNSQKMAPTRFYKLVFASSLLFIIVVPTQARHRQFDDDNEELRASNEQAFAKSQGSPEGGTGGSDKASGRRIIDAKARHYLGDSFDGLTEAGKLNHLLELVPFLYGKIDDLTSKHEACQRMYQVEAKETRSNTFIQELQAQVMELKQAHFDKERAWSNAFHESTATIDEIKNTLTSCENKLTAERSKVNRITSRANGGGDTTGSSNRVVYTPSSDSVTATTTTNKVVSGSESSGSNGGGALRGNTAPEEKSTFKWHIEKIS